MITWTRRSRQNFATAEERTPMLSIQTNSARDPAPAFQPTAAKPDDSTGPVEPVKSHWATLFHVLYMLHWIEILLLSLVLTVFCKDEYETRGETETGTGFHDALLALKISLIISCAWEGVCFLKLLIVTIYRQFKTIPAEEQAKLRKLAADADRVPPALMPAVENIAQYREAHFLYQTPVVDGYVYVCNILVSVFLTILVANAYEDYENKAANNPTSSLLMSINTLVALVTIPLAFCMRFVFFILQTVSAGPSRTF